MIFSFACFLNNEKFSETTNEGSIISLTKRGSLRDNFIDDTHIVDETLEQYIFQLSSDSTGQEQPRTFIGDENYDYTFGLDNRDQILLRSERITIDSRTDSIFLSSFKHIYLGCKENLNMRICIKYYD